MRTVWSITIALLSTTASASAHEPFEAFLLDENLEVALARSAAPAKFTGEASILVLGREGYRTVREGTNGFTCLVLRSWDGPGAETEAQRFYDVRQRAPICFNPSASSSTLGVHLRRTELVARGTPLETIRATLASELEAGRLHFTSDGLGVAYMFSSGQRIGPDADHWRPHVMIYGTPTDGANLGSHPFGPAAGNNEPSIFTIPVADFIDPETE